MKAAHSTLQTGRSVRLFKDWLQGEPSPARRRARNHDRGYLKPGAQRVSAIEVVHWVCHAR